MRRETFNQIYAKQEKPLVNDHRESDVQTVEDFVKNFGVIKVIPFGVSGYKHKSIRQYKI